VSVDAARLALMKHVVAEGKPTATVSVHFAHALVDAFPGARTLWEPRVRALGVTGTARATGTVVIRRRLTARNERKDGEKSEQ